MYAWFVPLQKFSTHPDYPREWLKLEKNVLSILKFTHVPNAKSLIRAIEWVEIACPKCFSQKFKSQFIDTNHCVTI